MDKCDKDKFMREALVLASQAGEMGEIPIGAVIVKDDIIIGRGANCNRTRNNPTRHAEIIAIEEACEKLSNERLIGCSLYVTKEPCTMCAGAIIHARIAEIYFGASDEKYGACGTVFNICGNDQYNHVPVIYKGMLKNDSSLLLKDFFKRLRDEKN
ncbi:MAG TPA: tRNA adenosine(34) deaminase TadA [Spirochaetota bacterium]|nr:tRNA adenosine(34) deaminase TadA [Spirochaetota bacterium]